MIPNTEETMCKRKQCFQCEHVDENERNKSPQLKSSIIFFFIESSAADGTEKICENRKWLPKRYSNNQVNSNSHLPSGYLHMKEMYGNSGNSLNNNIRFTSSNSFIYSSDRVLVQYLSY